MMFNKKNNLFTRKITKGLVASSVSLMLILTSGLAQASTLTPTWTAQWGTLLPDQAYSVAVDSSGNTYTTGETGSDLDGNISAGSSDIFLTKYDNQGVKLWTVQLGSSNYDDGTGVVVDNNNNVYVTGSTQGDLDGNVHIGAVGKSNIFLTKFDSNGGKQWTRTMGTEYGNESFAKAVAVDNSGYIYITGGADGALDGVTSYTLNSDIFLAKYDSAGTVQWIQTLGSSPNNGEYGRSVTVDGSGNVYVTGWTSGNLDGNISAGYNDIFLLKYDGQGAKLWTRQWGTATAITDQGFDVTVDSSGNAYVTGLTDGDLDGNTNANLGISDFFLTKYNDLGVKQWTRQLGSSGYDTGRAVEVDDSGNVYVAGNGTLDGYPDGTNKNFLAKFDGNTGDKYWTQLGIGIDENFNGMALDAFGHAYIAGSYRADLILPNGYNDSDIFLIKADITGPVANAGPDQVITLHGQTADVILDGSASYDDGSILSYTWTGSFGTAIGVSPTVALGVGTHTITLEVNDGIGGISTDTVVITVELPGPPGGGGRP